MPSADILTLVGIDKTVRSLGSDFFGVDHMAPALRSWP